MRNNEQQPHKNKRERYSEMGGRCKTYLSGLEWISKWPSRPLPAREVFLCSSDTAFMRLGPKYDVFFFTANDAD